MLPTSFCTAPARAANGSFATIPAREDADLRFFAPGGGVTTGARALAAMRTKPGLVLWVAGNQFFAMERVVRDFQRSSRAANVAVGVVTLPPGLELQAILDGGFTYGGRAYPGRPDVYATVDLAALRALRRAGLMRDYTTYAHNELQIMVARGNPKHIVSVADLVRPGVRTSMPNPVDEGIMTVYAEPMLVRHRIWQRIAAGKSCRACYTTSDNWFTAVHHRETPARIASDRSDAGIVWRTEVLNAERAGAPVEGVSLPEADSRRANVTYLAGALASSNRPKIAARYLAFLASTQGQRAYAAFGFVPATPQERVTRAIALLRVRNRIGRVVIARVEQR
ncbi:MAG: substrate-binding domain-containing protein [Candidatus Eremiobacteraeota bacterium]|nr:substrate-binding domain-containing protein [Candidatus Eremiobacteraeota bacterium]